jgi:hypothetical protein
MMATRMMAARSDGGVGMASSSPNPRYANGHRRRELRRWLRSQRRPCWICVAFGKSGAIDYSLPAGHPLSFEVDELVPVSKRGNPLSRSNVDAAHRCCNQWRGNRSVEEVLRIARNGRADANPPACEPVDGVTSSISG